MSTVDMYGDGSSTGNFYIERDGIAVVARDLTCRNSQETMVSIQLYVRTGIFYVTTFPVATVNQKSLPSGEPEEKDMQATIG
ncbi:hypothetical protein J3459_017555 [Metarhizium acridum]|nr:hypothetical protein J3459_017555 [Metarhizium acridum]